MRDSVLARLHASICPDIVIDITPDTFHITRQGRTVSFQTVIFLSTEQPPKVIAVGGEHTITVPHIRIDLFKPNGSESDFLDKAQCLEAFLRYCITFATLQGSVLQRLLRPRVVLRNTKSLSGIFCGYENYVLKNITLQAGVRECLFE